MAKTSKTALIGSILLAAGISIYVSIQMVTATRVALPVDLFSYLFRSVSSAPDMGSACKGLDPFGECSPLIYSSWLGSLLISFLGDYAPMVFTTLYLVLTYMITYELTRNHLTAGISALIAAGAPSVNYWFRYGNQGPHLFVVLLMFSLYILLRYRWDDAASSNRLLVALFASSALSALLYPGHWILLLSYSPVVIYGFVENLPRKKILEPAGVLVVSSLVPAAFYGLEFFNSFVVTGILVLAPLALLVLIGDKFLKKSGTRLLYSASVTVGCILVLGLFIASNVLKPYRDVFTKIYEPGGDFGLLAALSMAGIVLLIGKKMLKCGTCETLLLSSLLTWIITPYFDPSTTLATTALMSTVSALVLQTLTVGISTEVPGGRRRIVAPLAIGLMFLAVGASIGVSGYYATSTQPIMLSYDLRFYQGFGESSYFDTNPWIALLSQVREDMSSLNNDTKVLIVSYWDYSYWIKYHLDGAGKQVIALSSTTGSERGKYLVSALFTSDEQTAAKILESLLNETDASVAYIFIAYTASVQYRGNAPGNTSYFGLVYFSSENLNVGSLERSTFYLPAGDQYRIPLYLQMSGKDPTSILNPWGVASQYELGLAWNNKGLETLVPKLSVHAMNALGYETYNRRSSYNKLEASPMFFKLVNATYTPFMKTEYLIGTYQVIYVVAAYKYVKGGVSNGSA